MLAHRCAFCRVILCLATISGCIGREPLGTVSEDLTQCVTDGTLPGMDISNGNGSINWSMVHGGGIVFAYMKATQGTGYTDGRFATNWAGARASGVARGAYHFFDPTADGTLQAQHFLTVMGTLSPGDLPPMLDIECPDGDPMCLGYAGGSGIAPGSTIRTRMLDWLSAVQTATGRTPLIYTFPSYFSGAGVTTTGLDTYPLFIANINGTPCFTAPSPWARAAVWQYNWNGTVPGIAGNVDLDRFMGTAADLAAFASGTVGPPMSGPAWAAQYVSESWPLSSVGHVQLHPDERLTVNIVERNVGTHAWDGSTRLATTVPRNRVSALAGPDWIAPDRPAGVTGTVAPGGMYAFTFTIVGPATPGTYDEHLGLVEDGTAWFGDPGQGGPADDVIELIVDVSGSPVDAGAPPDGGRATDGGNAADAHAPTDGETATDASVPPDTADAREAGTDGGTIADTASGMPAGAEPTGGCGCAVQDTRPCHTVSFLGVGAMGFVSRRRRRQRA